jgi:hypothetical protein
MRILRSFFALSLAALLTACASGPKMAEVASSIPPLKANEARVFFYRSGSMMGAAIQPNISLNGKVVGVSKPGGFFFVTTAPGAMEVSTATEVEKKLTFTLEAGQTRYVRTKVGFGIAVGRVYPELVDSAEGAKELAETSYIGEPLKR